MAQRGHLHLVYAAVCRHTAGKYEGILYSGCSLFLRRRTGIVFGNGRDWNLLTMALMLSSRCACSAAVMRRVSMP